MENELRQPALQPATPQSGWWKSPASLATDPVFLRVTEKYRLAAVGLHTAAIGWALTHNAEDGWVPVAAVVCGQVCAAPREELENVAKAIVTAGIWCEAVVNGIEGFVVAGAEKAVRERYARQVSASNAGRASQTQHGSSTANNRWPKRQQKIDPDRQVDWSQVSEEL